METGGRKAGEACPIGGRGGLLGEEGKRGTWRSWPSSLRHLGAKGRGEGS